MRKPGMIRINFFPCNLCTFETRRNKAGLVEHMKEEHGIEL